jgi:hypothetical protein
MYDYWFWVTWPVSDCTVSYRPVLSSERAPYRKNNTAIATRERIKIQSGHGPQKGARYQDEMVDWPSAIYKLNSTHSHQLIALYCFVDWIKIFELSPRSGNVNFFSPSVFTNPPEHVDTCRVPRDSSKDRHRLSCFVQTSIEELSVCVCGRYFFGPSFLSCLDCDSTV